MDEKQLRKEIIKAMYKFYGENERKREIIKKIENHKEIFSNAVHKKIDVQMTDICIVIVTTFLNMSGGSVGDINLYELLGKYLLDKNKRKEINNILGV